MTQREQRRALVELGRAAVGGREHAERAQLLLDEELDVLPAHAASVALADNVGDRLGSRWPSQASATRKSSGGELDDLAVGAAGEQRGLLEARALELADQLDALCEPRRGRLRSGAAAAAMSSVVLIAAAGSARYEPDSSPCSIEEVWSASAWALPSMFCTITES